MAGESFKMEDRIEILAQRNIQLFNKYNQKRELLLTQIDHKKSRIKELNKFKQMERFNNSVFDPEINRIYDEIFKIEEELDFLCSEFFLIQKNLAHLHKISMQVATSTDRYKIFSILCKLTSILK
jgi:hypothetical protein